MEPNFKTYARKPKRGTVPTKIKRWVRERDGYRCVARIETVCTGRADHVHHIVRKSQGGDNTMGNLISLCLACHQHIHANVAWARSHGYIRSRSTVEGS